MKQWIFLLAGLCAFHAARAEDAFPSRSVHIVVPYTPGPGADLLSRVRGPKLSERWKAAVVTDNRPGATGNIGAEIAAKSAPDGYTLLLTATSFATNPALSRTLPFDPVKDFEPVLLLATGGLGVYVHPRTPAKSLRGLIELSRPHPCKPSHCSSRKRRRAPPAVRHLT